MERTLKRSSLLFGAALLAVILVVFATFSVLRARANPSDINQTNVTATTTITYVTSGGTATETYDSYASGVSDPNASDSAVLLTAFTASSTSSVLAIKIQYSMNGIDWYDDNLFQIDSASSTQAFGIGTPNSFTWTAAGTATAYKAIIVPTPTRYMRAVYTLSGANAGLWKSIIAKKQQPS